MISVRIHKEEEWQQKEAQQVAFEHKKSRSSRRKPRFVVDHAAILWVGEIDAVPK